MDRSQAISVIRASIARGTETPCTWREDRENYIAEQSERLLQAVIDPVRITVEGELFSYGAKDQLTKEQLYAIARAENNWLIYSATSGVFSLAFGTTPECLSILGFSSTDALTEWLG